MTRREFLQREDVKQPKGSEPIRSHVASKLYRDNWARVFKKAEAAQARYRRTNHILASYDKAMAAERKKRH